MVLAWLSTGSVNTSGCLIAPLSRLYRAYGARSSPPMRGVVARVLIEWATRRSKRRFVGLACILAVTLILASFSNVFRVFGVGWVDGGPVGVFWGCSPRCNGSALFEN